MSAGVCMYEGFISDEMSTFSTANGTAFRGTLRVPDSRKMLDGSYGSMFKDFVVWPGSNAYRTIERMNQNSKSMGAGSQVKIVMLETEAEYMNADNKRVSSNYEALDISFVSRSSKGTATDTTTATATSVVDTPPSAAPGGITL